MKTLINALPLIALSLSVSQTARAADDGELMTRDRNNCLIGAAVGTVAVGGLVYLYNKDAFFHAPMKTKDAIITAAMIVPGSCVAGAVVGAMAHGNSDAPNEESIHEEASEGDAQSEQ